MREEQQELCVLSVPCFGITQNEGGTCQVVGAVNRKFTHYLSGQQKQHNKNPSR
jgi:hypothetical protein